MIINEILNALKFFAEIPRKFAGGNEEIEIKAQNTLNTRQRSTVKNRRAESQIFRVWKHTHAHTLTYNTAFQCLRSKHESSNVLWTWERLNEGEAYKWRTQTFIRSEHDSEVSLMGCERESSSFKTGDKKESRIAKTIKWNSKLTS